MKEGSRFSSLVALVKRGLGAFRDILFPEDITCDICGNELRGDLRYRLCADCASKMPFIRGNYCVCCGAPISGEGEYCLRCQRSRGSFDINRSPLEYDGPAKDLIYALKFGKKKYIARTLAAMMADTFIEHGMEADIVVCVPMTDKELKKRGFNQSELLAKDVANRLNMPFLPALVKLKETSQQKQLSGEERANNLQGAFECVFRQVKNRRILLIDDVFTTGATANECAKTLINAGARSTSVLTAAVTRSKIPAEGADGNGYV